MGALDQVVVPRDVLVAGDGFVVAQEVERVLVAVQQMPAAVEEGLGDAVSHRPGGGHFLSPALCHRPARQMESLPQVLWP